MTALLSRTMALLALVKSCPTGSHGFVKHEEQNATPLRTRAGADGGDLLQVDLLQVDLL